MRVITHLRPHLDEIFAWWLLWYFGKNKFPNIRSAKLEAMDSGFPRESEGIILLGVGGGRFDEHASNGNARSAKSCASLVAEFLGLSQVPEIKYVLGFVERNDNGDDEIKRRMPWDLPNLVGAGYKAGRSQEYVTAVTFSHLDDLFKCQRDFHRSVKRFKELSHERVLPSGAKIVCLHGDLEQANSVALSDAGGGADLFIWRNSHGIQIFSDQQSKIAQLGTVRLVAKLRFEEQKVAGAVKVSDWKLLSADGKLDDVPQWFFQRKAKCIYNGTLTQSAPPTKLSLERIVALAEEAMTESAARLARPQ